MCQSPETILVTKSQADIEERMIEKGIKRGSEKIALTLKKGMAAATPAGITAMRRAMGPVIDFIEQEKKEAFTGRAGYRKQAIKLISDIDPELLAYIAIRGALDNAARHNALQYSANEVASRILEEINAARFEQVSPDLYNSLIRDQKKRGQNERHQEITIKLAARDVPELERIEWNRTEKTVIGTMLIDAVREATGLIQTELRRGNRKVTRIITLTPEINEWFHDYNAAACVAKPFYLPMVEPPLPWVSPKSQIYRTANLPEIAIMNNPKPRKIAALEENDLSEVYSALNTIQETPWQVNLFVLDVMERIWESGEDVKCLPPKRPREIPDSPLEVKNDVKGGPIRKQWRKKVRKIHEENARNVSKRFEFVRTLMVAQDYRDVPEFYFPYRCDFRGRVYAMSTSYNPQGSDVARGLLKFAAGVPLTSPGVYWLGVHGANLWGYDKVSFKDRYWWAEEYRENAKLIARDPLTHIDWMDADDPWQFLAWCKEWATASPGQLSYLPVAMDGSCNGLQHYAAMLRDPVSGRAVNLLPSDEPQDIYREVAERTLELLRNADKEHEHYWIVETWATSGLVDRKVTKRPVMVLPYGGRYQSCLAYVRAAIQDKFEEGVANPFGDEIGRATAILATFVWRAIDDVVTGAVTAMQYLQTIARELARHEIPIQWTTPVGWTVFQEYLDRKLVTVKTRFNGALTWLRYAQDLTTINPNKQATAFAPNFVHSLDAAAMVRTANRLKSTGIPHMAMIHDSYGVHASHINDMHRILREEFVDMYNSRDPLAELRAWALEVLPKDTELPEVPEKGSLDLTEVLHSEYFFA